LLHHLQEQNEFLDQMVELLTKKDIV